MQAFPAPPRWITDAPQIPWWRCQMLTIDRVKQALEYSNTTGQFKWTSKKSSTVRDNRIAGTQMKNGYIAIVLDNHRLLAHRLAWFYTHGVWPEKQIDHINGIRDDNRIVNLRLADQAINSQNLRKAQPRSTTGFLGVFPWGRTGRFLARIHANGKYHKIGVFDTPEQAHQAYLTAKRKLHPGTTI